MVIVGPLNRLRWLTTASWSSWLTAFNPMVIVAPLNRLRWFDLCHFFHNSGLRFFCRALRKGKLQLWEKTSISVGTCNFSGLVCVSTRSVAVVIQSELVLGACSCSDSVCVNTGPAAVVILFQYWACSGSDSVRLSTWTAAVIIQSESVLDLQL